ncbi:MAG: hypothetical protein ACK4ND_08685 [Cytophagaceae bacterium]
MFARFIIIITILTYCVSCSKLEVKPDTTGFVEYTIKENSHRSTISRRSFEGNELRFAAIFDESAQYQIADNKQGDTNKLYGFSDCNSNHHHDNSARFGWRWFENQLQIMAYTYVNGKMSFKYITSLDLNKEYEYSLRMNGDKYVFSVNGEEVEMHRACSDEKASGYYLFPYFGGETKAPHEINIRIREI